MRLNSNKKSLSKRVTPKKIATIGKRIYRCCASIWTGGTMSFFLSPLIFITILSSIFFEAVQKVQAKHYLQQALVWHHMIIAELFGYPQFFYQANHQEKYNKGGQQWIH